jgi:hypothetical protein
MANESVIQDRPESEKDASDSRGRGLLQIRVFVGFEN